MRQFVADRYGYKAWVETLRRSGRKAAMHYELDEGVLKGEPHCVFVIGIDQPTVSRH